MAPKAKFSLDAGCEQNQVMIDEPGQFVMATDESCCLMVCLCDAVGDGIVSDILPGAELCDQHNNAVKLQSLIRNDVNCLLHTKNENGDIIPLKVP